MQTHRTHPRQQPNHLLRIAVVATALLAATFVALPVFASVFDPRSGGRPGAYAPADTPPPSAVVTPAPTPKPDADGEPKVTPSASPTPTPTPTPAPVVTPAPLPPTPVPTAPPVVTPTQPPAADYSRPGGIYLDVLTPRHGYGDWSSTILDTIYMLPSSYWPGDLVDSSAAGLNGGYPVRSIMVSDLAAMADAARAAGAPLEIVSGFRSHEQQRATFDYWVSVGGYEQALRTSARPGHSEHQLGTAIDFTSQGGDDPWNYADWAQTPAGAWMAQNAWRYGFVMSYPAGKFAETGYDYEPWHYRYVGRSMAQSMVQSGMTPREYLWYSQ